MVREGKGVVLEEGDREGKMRGGMGRKEGGGEKKLRKQENEERKGKEG